MYVILFVRDFWLIGLRSQWTYLIISNKLYYLSVDTFQMEHIETTPTLPTPTTPAHPTTLPCTTSTHSYHPTHPTFLIHICCHSDW